MAYDTSSHSEREFLTPSPVLGEGWDEGRAILLQYRKQSRIQQGVLGLPLHGANHVLKRHLLRLRDLSAVLVFR